MNETETATDDRLTELGITNPSLAQAESIKLLGKPKGAATRTLTVIEKSDLPRIVLFSAMENLTKWKWLNTTLESELLARSSLRRKGIRGRDDLVKISSSKEETKGALGAFKDSIKNFFDSGSGT